MLMLRTSGGEKIKSSTESGEAMFRFRDFFSRSFSKSALIALLVVWGES
jgi:hypothetical protein